MTDQEQNNSAKDAVNPENVDLLIAEYNALREEILKRTEIGYQIIALTLTASGIILTVGLQTKDAPILLIYPILSLFLAAIWTNNHDSTVIMGTYIRKHIEPRATEKTMGWEYYLHQNPKVLGFRAITSTGIGAIFIITGLLAILAGLSVTTFNATEIFLLTLDVLSILLSVILFILVSLVSIRKRG